MNKKHKFIICLMIFTTLVFVALVVCSFTVIKKEDKQKKIDEEFDKWKLTKGNEAIPYRCCNKVSCGCSTYLGQYSCSFLLANLTEGDCGNGYFCCQRHCDTCYDTCRSCSARNKQGQCTSWYYYQCNPHDCNCHCILSVPNQLCNIVCGTCNVMITYFTYNTHIGKINATYTDRCDRDNNVCVSEFKDKYAIGSVRDVWYKKKNPYEYSFDEPSIDYKPSDWLIALMVLSCVFMSGFFIATIIVMCYLIGKNRRISP